MSYQQFYTPTAPGVFEICLLKAMDPPLPYTLPHQATQQHHHQHQGAILTLTRHHRSLQFIKDTWLKTILHIHPRLITTTMNMKTIPTTVPLSLGAGWLPFASAVFWTNVFKMRMCLDNWLYSLVCVFCRFVDKSK
ncbi:hypothetical protein LXL04_007635 [Taraxacum kok-saghyz]